MFHNWVFSHCSIVPNILTQVFIHNLSVDEELCLALGSYEMLNNVYGKKKRIKRYGREEECASDSLQCSFMRYYPW
jgi:hypothetical protein